MNYPHKRMEALEAKAKKLNAKLKHCPWCGPEAEYPPEIVHTHIDAWWVSCENCGTDHSYEQVPGRKMSPIAAFDAWNNRYQPTIKVDL